MQQVHEIRIDGRRTAFIPAASREEAEARLAAYQSEPDEDEQFEFARRYIQLRDDDGAEGPHIRFEYDLGFTGGEYSGVGNFAHVPLSLADETSPEEAFERHTGYGRIHIIHYSPDELYTAGGERYEDGD